MAGARLPDKVRAVYAPVARRFLDAVTQGRRLPAPELSGAARPRRRAALLLDLVEGATRHSPHAFRSVFNASKQLFLYRLLLETERLYHAVRDAGPATPQGARALASSQLWLLEEQLAECARALEQKAPDQRTWWYLFAVEENLPRIERLERRRPPPSA